MIFLAILEYLIVILVVLGLITQVFYPMMVGTKLFPLFRREHRELDEKLTEVVDEIQKESVKAKIQEITTQLDKIQGRNKSNEK